MLLFHLPSIIDRLVRSRAGWSAMLLSAGSIALAQSTIATPRDGTSSVAPVCVHPSHDRLKIRRDRDACAATLNRAGQPTARGFMPTQCARPTDQYRIDAIGLEDRCFGPAARSQTGEGGE